MSSNRAEDIFSIRIVIADFYMEKPIHGLDICYSEFRGNEIKKVPIIRVFGSNSHGQKTCMHVHGVFPYFYIPYEKKDFESVNKAIYQIAINVDKAINISLGQGSSATQHVFKVQLVKGIPFYGYHRGEHQFLKIYMFNPRFVRRAANLLQNGAIMGKNFHPFESHVPYILQFMIDYNLYGMSLLHVPLEIVKFRRTDDVETVPFADAQLAQILNTSVAKKLSSSALEVDIGSNFILNRFQLLTQSSNTHANPGIEAIWHDERMRRHTLALTLAGDDEKLHAIPTLEVPVSQERANVQPTESDIFYRTALLSKLVNLEMSTLASGSQADQTLNNTLQVNATYSSLNSTSTKEQKRTFNLRKIMGNSVYPEECTQDDKLTNASFIENHLLHNSLFEATGTKPVLNRNESSDNTTMSEDDNAFLEDTIIDEELVLSLTQATSVPVNASLCAEDMELLDVLQQLEEGNCNEQQVDLDSSLAPLTQQHKDFELTPELLDKQTVAAVANQPLSDSDSESDNGCADKIHDFSKALDDFDELILKLTPSQPTPDATPTTSPTASPTLASHMTQVDGADDQLRTPTKLKQIRKPQDTSPSTPKTSKQNRMRTPRSSVSKKYAPLPLIITNRSDIKNLISSLNEMSPEKTTKTSRLSLDVGEIKSSKGRALWERRRKSLSDANDVERSENTNTPTRRARKTADLDKTHITCALTPRRKSERLLKVYNLKNMGEVIAPSETTKMDLNSKVVQKSNSKEERKNEKPSVGDELAESSKSKVEENNKNLDYSKSREILVRKNIIGRNLKSTKSALSITVENIDLTDSESISKSHSSGSEVVKDSEQNYIETPESTNKHNLVEEIEEVSDSEDRLANTTKRKSRHNAAEEIEEITDSEENCISVKIQDNKKSSPDSKAENELECLSSEVEEDEEIGASDTELEHAHVKMRKSLNLRKSRRSFYLSRKHNINSSISRETDVLEILKTPEKQEANTDDDDESDGNDDPKIRSFYETSFLDVNSPTVFSEGSNPAVDLPKTTQEESVTTTIITTHRTSSSSLKTIDSSGSGDEQTVVVTPLDLPPTYEDVLVGCYKLDIHEYEFQKPYYSNPDDITKQKEVGYKVLHITGNKLNDCADFESVLGSDLRGLVEWRRQKLFDIGGPLALHRYRNAQQVREYFASQKKILITPQMNAPSRHEAKVWLKGRALLKSQGNGSAEKERQHLTEEDSPIKVRRQRITMMMNDEVGDADEDRDCSTRSITLTPMTPNVIIKADEKSSAVTPLTTHASDDSASASATGKGISKRARLSLNARLKAAVNADRHSTDSVITENTYTQDLSGTGGSSNAIKPSEQSINTSSTSISSQSVLAELERSSFVKNLQSGTAAEHDTSFGLSSATLNNTFGFKVDLENLQQAKSDIECNYLTTMTLEVFVLTRDNLYPNPELDEIRCIFYAVEHSLPADESNDKESLPKKECGYIIVNDQSDILREGKVHGLDADIKVKVVQTEIEALEALLQLCAQWDPDIYAGYEIDMASWGYVMERAKYLCFNIGPLLSRVPSQKVREFVDEDREHFTDLDFEMKLCGRILLDVWRLMRSEIALTSYTFENVMYHILHKRGPSHSFRDLTNWFITPGARWIVIEYYLERVRGTLALLEQLDLIGRTSEMAKLIGIQFYEVLSRGSQFRVESMMLRMAKPKNLVPLSPSVQQRAHMRAPEYLPLILEPKSCFYSDPVIVLDFQSLYPSMIIAYNYCFSTCLGRVEHLGQSTPFEFGASQLRVSPVMLRKLFDRDLITISPCGVVFVKSSVREGILPRMLTEILNTRQMVKQSMKLHKANSALQRVLHSRQLGLKLMANVTYGYTAANFSGRMPAVEVGDSVVAKGRETLEQAIKLVEANEKWKVKVVYGDTDSMFVLVPGRNRQQAFKIGEEIVEAVTKTNPQPVKLKLEKVYQPCILQTKKRYVGYMYETAEQSEPVYEAKGIETVRRDGCPAVAKMLEKVLRILFETADVSQAKQYVCRQFAKLLSGRANLQDLIFAKEFRGLNGYKPTACVPALELTRKWLQTDPRRIPRCGERVPFIIINGPPGVPLIRLVRSPHEVLADEGLKINAIYYITKAIIPPLNRCLLLIGADANEWFANLPRKLLMTPALCTANELVSNTNSNQQKKSTISQYFSTTNCAVDCGRHTKQGICGACERDVMKTFVTLHAKIGKIERGYQLTQQICQACCGRVGDLNCDSLDCPVLYVLEMKRRDLKQIEYFHRLLEERF